MLFKKKGIPDSTVLKLIAKVLEKESPTKKLKLKTKKGDVVLTYSEVVRFVVELAQRLDDGRYGAISRCNTCGNWSCPGQKGKKGWCSVHSQPEPGDGYCSDRIPMTEQQKQTRRIMNERFNGAIQTQRVGNGTKNSSKSH